MNPPRPTIVIDGEEVELTDSAMIRILWDACARAEMVPPYPVAPTQEADRG